MRVVQAFGRERGVHPAVPRDERGAVRRQPRDGPDLDAGTSRSSSSSASSAIAMIVGVGGLFVDQGIVTVGTVAAFVLYLNNLFEPVQQLSQLYNTVQSAGAALQQAVRAARHASRRSPSGPARSTSRPSARSRSTTCRSATPTGPTCCTTCRSTSRRASGSRSSARPARASRRWRSSSPASTTRARASCASAASTCATRRSRRCASASSSCRRRASSSPGTIRDNVRVGRPDATDAEVDAALEALGLRERFAALPDGLDTEVRERGSRALGGRASARVARACRARRPAGARARRGDVEPRPGHRARGRARARGAHRGPHRRRGRAPAVDRGALPTGSRWSTTAASSSSAPTTSSSSREGRYASLWASWSSSQAKAS